MQYIDNDMDDLFKKAGENYPLRTDGADWDALQARLAVNAESAALPASRKINRNYFWLLLLLLIPLVMITDKDGNSFLSKKNTHSESNTHSGLKNPGNDLSANHHSKADNDLKNGNPSPGIASLNNNNSSIPSLSAITNKQDLKSRSAKYSDDKIISITTYHSENKNHFEDKTSAIAPQVRNVTDNQASDGSSGKDPIPVDSTTALLRQPNRKASVSINNMDTPIVKVTPKKNNSRPHGMYYGIVAGPDISTVKSQKVLNAGYSTGAIVGYRINKHWAVEAGALWNKKKYYTNGEYFNKEKANIPPSVTVHSMDGSCGMIEIPVAVRYDLNLKKNSFFITAGFTSYLMKNESYTYKADNNGNYYDGFKSYKNSGNYIFSNMQLSAGYQYNLSRKLSLRFEPYIKIPVKNIGIGSLPISSKGLYIGIMRNIR
jgi:hypothetical protein